MVFPTNSIVQRLYYTLRVRGWQIHQPRPSTAGMPLDAPCSLLSVLGFRSATSVPCRMGDEDFHAYGEGFARVATDRGRKRLPRMKKNTMESLSRRRRRGPPAACYISFISISAVVLPPLHVGHGRALFDFAQGKQPAVPLPPSRPQSTRPPRGAAPPPPPGPDFGKCRRAVVGPVGHHHLDW